jgi:hypothetical protein
MHCNKLIHWETSWRPTIMEQRNGRIDRHGQPRDVSIFHFAPHDYAQTAGRGRDELDDDLEFLFVAARKVSSIREDLGKVGPVIAAQVEEKMLGKRKALDTAATESENQNVRKLLKAEINFADQVRRLREEFESNRREMNISPDAESGRELLKGVSDSEIYNATLTVMMRMMFLLCAEERKLLPVDGVGYVCHLLCCQHSS